jgi:predicted Zn-dependent peptidase
MMLRKALLAAASLAVLGLPLAADAQGRAPARRASATPTSAVANLPIPDVPYTKFVLSNGLTVLVHEDRKAPVVAVNVWYHVGSRNEPQGKSGFAHLFEHLMFNGSQNANEDYFKTLERIGATDLNGTTNVDRTNYFQNVPTAALDTVLWLESDRMGHLLGAVDQARLDEQRGVVQNEKRQGENQPYGKAYNTIVDATYPNDHPYGHTVIGSMEDLNAAKLADVQEWFRTYYGPSNSVVVLAGDIDVATARAKMEKFFGDIPPGPPVTRQERWIHPLQTKQRAVNYDRVAQGRLYRVYNVPEYGSADATYLNLLAGLLASDKTSRLYERLIYRDQTATQVSAGLNAAEIGGQLTITVTAKPGGDLQALERVVDEEVERLLRDGPTAAEMAKIKTQRLSAFVKGLERVGGFGGKSDILAQNQVYLGRPDAYKEQLERIRTASARDVQETGRRWLTGGNFTLEVRPYESFAAAPTGADRTRMPVPGTPAAPQFPAVERATLSNGLKVIVARRTGVPVVSMGLVLDAGQAADQGAKPGTANLAMDMLDEGTRTRDALEISRELSMLGADLGVGSGLDTSTVSMTALKPNLDRSLQLFADVILNPAFEQDDMDRLKALQVAAIQRQKREPLQIGFRVIDPIIYGAQHPYGVLETEASVGALTREDMARFHQTWFKPNNATLVVVGDTSLAEIRPMLEQRFAAWRPGQAPAKTVASVQAPARSTVYLVDRPGAEQTVIMAALPAPQRNDPAYTAIETMNTTLGGAFVSRLNMNLREAKGWSYGAGSFVQPARGPGMFIAYAPVQSDKTKESIAEFRRELREIVKDRVITADEAAVAQSNLIQSLPGSWETNAALRGAITTQVTYNLPETYWQDYAGTVRALTVNDLNQAAVRVVNNDALTWVIVGDRAKIEAGLRELNMGEIRVIDADARPVGAARAAGGAPTAGR